MKHLFACLSLRTILWTATVHSQSTGPNSFNDAALFNKDSLAREIKVLASNAFQGRKPFMPGETKTIDYLKSRFIGVEPGNGKSYFQDVPMVHVAMLAAPQWTYNHLKVVFS